MVIYEKAVDCCGCGLCAVLCPQKAISLREDDEGFVYPVIDASHCVECGACKRNCSFQRLPAVYPEHDCYIARHTDEAILRVSSSGGVFTALAEYALSQGGLVLGAVFDEQFMVCHTTAVTAEALLPMHGSKYLPSDITSIFSIVENALGNKRTVLFTGTPCQVAAVRRFVEVRKLPNSDCLITMDLLCHGIASPVIWRDYLADIGARYGKPAEIYFRSKDKGWSHHAMKIKLSDGGDISDVVNRAMDFFILWTSQCMTRLSCHYCPFSCSERTGDFSTGDFVGIEKLQYAYPIEDGVSLMMANSDRARLLTKQLPMILQPVSLQQGAQPSLQYPVAPPRDRKRFWKTYRAQGFSGIVRHYGHYRLEKWLVYKMIVPVCKKLGIYSLAARWYLKRNENAMKL